MSYLLRIKGELLRHSARLHNITLQSGSCPKCGHSTLSQHPKQKVSFPAGHKEDIPSFRLRRYSTVNPTNSYLLSPLRKIKKRKLKKSSTLTEVIEVSNDASVSETQQPLNRLKAKDVLNTSMSFQFSTLPPITTSSSLFSASESLTLALSENNGYSFSDPVPYFSLPSSSSQLSAEQFEIDSSYLEKMPFECSTNDNEGIFYPKGNFINTSLIIPGEADLIDSIGDIESELNVVASAVVDPKIDATSIETNSPLSHSSSTAIAKKRNNRKIKGRSLKKDEADELAKVKREDLEKLGREVSLNKSLLSYLELCVFNNNLPKAYNTLNYYRTRGNTYPQYSRVTNIASFNCLLHGYAAKGNIHRVLEVFQSILDDNIKPNCQSFSAIFECIGRSLDYKHASILEKAILSLEKHGFGLNDLFNDCIYTSDQREMVLLAILKVRPSFIPVVRPPNLNYICPLLDNLNETIPGNQVFTPAVESLTVEGLQHKANQQLLMELSGSITIKSIERKDNVENLDHFRKLSEETEKQWTQSIEDALQRNLNALSNHSQNRKNSRAINLYPFLEVLPPNEFAKIIIQEIRKLAEGSETYSPTVTQLHRELGNQVLNRYQIAYKKEAKILDKVQLLYDEYVKWYLDPNSSLDAKNPREAWQRLMFNSESKGPHIDVGDKMWPNSVVGSIGRFLYGIIMRDIKINANVMKVGAKFEQIVPAFYSIFRMQGVHLKEEIKPHPALVKLFQAASRDELTFDATLVPMVCPPLPWSSIRTGGYLLSAAKIVRLPFQAHQQKLRLESCPQEDLYPSLDSLNQLGAVPWKINHKVLDIVTEVFNNKGDESIGIPPPPSECPQPPHIEPTMSKQEKFKLHKQRLALKRRKAEMYSLWCDGLYRLSLANHFRNDVFWFPHNMDFRGRVYPCPPHLNHLGADVARAILVFAKGQPLGPNGLDWLKIHLVNLTGLKKRDSVAERLKYANAIMDDIFDSADEPLTGRKWWAQSEEPWQTLACCIEVANAIRSGDPVSYISHFPVHQDGSCNGLQHYAALGRDQAGAASVNLTPSCVPQDVYSVVATLVEKQRQKDADNGNKVAQVLEGFIKRKVIKQTVMTTVYGVTRYGARLQIAKQLKDTSGFSREHLWPASLYLVGKTFDSLQEMFTSTKEIQDWFTECAKLISKVCGQNVEWVTPLGLPVVQPYFRPSKKAMESYDSLKLPELHLFDMYERPNVMKQKNAFPPNFIHSLDSTHMMLTSLHSERSGITFVSVHDCYWTHPCTVEIMNRICREQFVLLHSQPILEDLSQFLLNKYSYKESEIVRDGSLIDMTKIRLNKILSQVPAKGSFDLNCVLDSVYFFS